MAISNNGELIWDDFYKGFIDGGYYEFKYHEKYFNVGLEIKGVFHKIKKWIFVVHKHDNNGAEIYSVYNNPQSLLENARIDGKSLQEVWNEIHLE